MSAVKPNTPTVDLRVAHIGPPWRIKRREFRAVDLELAEGRSEKQALQGPDGTLYLFKPDSRHLRLRSRVLPWLDGRHPRAFRVLLRYLGDHIPVESRRSIAFARLAQMMGVDVPVIQKVKFGMRAGSLQHIREVEPHHPIFFPAPGQDSPVSAFTRSRELLELLDDLAMVRDRARNLMYHPREHHVVAIDNDGAFFGEAGYLKLSAGQMETVVQIYERRDEVAALLGDLLTRAELDNFMTRLAYRREQVREPVFRIERATFGAPAGESSRREPAPRLQPVPANLMTGQDNPNLGGGLTR